MLGGRVRDPGRVAHEQHRGRHPRRQHSRVVASAGRQQRRRDVLLRQRRRQPVAQALIEHHGRRDRLGLGRQIHPVAGRRLPRGRQHLADHRLQGPLVRGAGVQPGAHPRADRVDRARLGGHLADRGARAVRGRGLPGGEHRGGEGQHRVTPVGEGGRARMVGPAGEVEPPAPVRPDLLADRDRRVQVRQRPSLLDVQFHVGADGREQVVVGPDAVRVVPGRRHRLGQRHPRGVGQRPGRARARWRRPAAGCPGRRPRTGRPPPR